MSRSEMTLGDAIVEIFGDQSSTRDSTDYPRSWSEEMETPKWILRYVKLKAIGISTLFVIIGGLSLYWGPGCNSKTWETILLGVGSTFLSIGIIQIVWELGQKRDFYKEIFEISKLKYDVQQAGLTGISNQSIIVLLSLVVEIA